jgi:hypothetical protein
LTEGFGVVGVSMARLTGGGGGGPFTVVAGADARGEVASSSAGSLSCRLGGRSSWGVDLGRSHGDEPLHGALSGLDEVDGTAGISASALRPPRATHEATHGGPTLPE